MPQELENAPELPYEVAYLWGYFIDMSDDRGSGMTVQKITSSVMKDWCWRTGNELELWERQAINSLDNAFIRANNG